MACFYDARRPTRAAARSPLRMCRHAGRCATIGPGRLMMLDDTSTERVEFVLLLSGCVEAAAQRYTLFRRMRPHYQPTNDATHAISRRKTPPAYARRVAQDPSLRTPARAVDCGGSVQRWRGRYGPPRSRRGGLTPCARATRERACLDATLHPPDTLCSRALQKFKTRQRPSALIRCEAPIETQREILAHEPCTRPQGSVPATPPFTPPPRAI